MKIDDYLDKLLDLALIAKNNDDIPISAMVIEGQKIIGYGYNTREKEKNILGHAEINAIIMATQKKENWNLQGTTMIVTLKPCSMCMEIIKQTRIDKVYYLLDKLDNKKEYNKTDFLKLNSSKEKKYKILLSDFFSKLREKK